MLYMMTYNMNFVFLVPGLDGLEAGLFHFSHPTEPEHVPTRPQSVLQAGLLSFPLTDFDSELRFAPKPYADRTGMAAALRRIGTVRRRWHG